MSGFKLTKSHRFELPDDLYGFTLSEFEKILTQRIPYKIYYKITVKDQETGINVLAKNPKWVLSASTPKNLGSLLCLIRKAVFKRNHSDFNPKSFKIDRSVNKR